MFKKRDPTSKLSYNTQSQLTEIPELNESRRETILPNIKNLKNENDFETSRNKLYLRPFSKFHRKLIFILFFCINLFINMDHGSIPAGVETLQKDLSLDEVEIGLLGSFVFFGLTLGILLPLF